ncbi:hypothetical protein [Actinomadura opuntiae]|uniref:hypothetical protein n=1 Tax=Actinomadura sp. OS1-43 TaxID=604315 RepID=UPI00255B0341|nr:hypothetical protein [Actinomadura sp. OS1-43]MDL4812760.1 hypothetical protein [Actinomadura sp. OS1-43]
MRTTRREQPKPTTPPSAKAIESLRNLAAYGGAVKANLTDMRKAGLHGNCAHALERRGLITTEERDIQYREWAGRELGTFYHMITDEGRALLDGLA